MSIWISDLNLWVAALACAAMFFTVSLAEAATSHGQEAQPEKGETSVPVLDDKVVVAAPDGYCIDNLATISGRRAAFVMMASCRALTGDSHAANPAVPGLLTASVDAGEQPLPAMEELNRYFDTERGRAALSRSGNGGSMTLGPVFSHGNVLYLNANEADAGPMLAGHSWRAVFEVNGQIVTATLRDFAEQPIAQDEGFRTLRQFVEELQAANLPRPVARPDSRGRRLRD